MERDGTLSMILAEGIYDDPDAEPEGCPHDVVVYLGRLGRTTWGRCRHCGEDIPLDDEPDFDMEIGGL